jgi:hypothetical protein
VSTIDRKIGFYNLVFEKYGTDTHYFDREFFKELLEYIFDLPDEEQIIDIPRYNKAIALNAYSLNNFHADYVVKVVFKSCKYNHSPEYMSSIDGSERDSDKKPYEGEKEKTHLCIRVSNYEAELILEERRSGVSITEITKYLNQKMREYLNLKNLKKNFKIIYGLVPSKDFKEMLNELKDVKIAEVHTSKKVLGSESMNIMDREDKSMKDEVVLTLKSNPKESMLKRNFSLLYDSIVGGESEVSRLRIYGHDNDGILVKLDSSVMKKIEYVTAELQENGTIETESIISKMINILGITEE